MFKPTTHATHADNHNHTHGEDDLQQKPIQVRSKQHAPVAS